jgi:hypothetical protein
LEQVVTDKSSRCRSSPLPTPMFGPNQADSVVVSTFWPPTAEPVYQGEFRYLTCNHATSEMGLGTQRRCDGVECAFHQVSFLFYENSRASSVAIDLENYSRGPWIF